MSNNPVSRNEMPVGLVMALSQNMDALSHFSTLPDEHKRAVIAGTRSIKSKQEMKQYVNSIPNQTFS